MKTLFLFFAFLLYFKVMLYSQVTLYSESFETDGEGVRYTSNTYSDCLTFDNPDFFLRTNINSVIPPTFCTTGFGTDLSNLQGSWFWAGEDIRSNSPMPLSRPPGNVTTSSINIAGYNTLTVSLYLATSNNNGTRWEWNDSLNIHASINNGAFFPVGRFAGSAQTGGDLRQDLNLDGIFDGAVVSVSSFTKYTFSIPGTGNTLRVELDFDMVGGSEEIAVDFIEVKGVVALPVELMSFDAKQVGNQVQLHWKTASEQNNSHFSIERGDENLRFAETGRVESAGAAHSYAWTDPRPLTGTNYYRLRQYDREGTSHLSPTVSVDYKNRRMQVEILPNPADEYARLNLQQETSGRMYISIIDMAGRLKWENTYDLEKGPQQIDLPVQQLLKGVYYIRIRTENGETGGGMLVRG
ncbi:MAG: T9SS type A sorting domain-containing protein [Bacteroidetes bacterium]|nr:T9SS type A sorting domain-containing protein [Bacteroidota bacterium]